MQDFNFEAKRQRLHATVDQVRLLVNEARVLTARRDDNTITAGERSYLDELNVQLKRLFELISPLISDLNLQELTIRQAYQRIGPEFAKVDPSYDDPQNGIGVRLFERGGVFDWKLSGQEHLHEEYSSAVRRALGRFAGKPI